MMDFLALWRQAPNLHMMALKYTSTVGIKIADAGILVKFLLWSGQHFARVQGVFFVKNTLQ